MSRGVVRLPVGAEVRDDRPSEAGSADVPGPKLPKRVYLIPGQGTDYRVYNNLNLGEGFETIHVYHSVPDKGMGMREYASILSEQIDTSGSFALIGLSLGGMSCRSGTDCNGPYRFTDSSPRRWSRRGPCSFSQS